MDEKPKRPPRKKPPAKRPAGRSGSAKQPPQTTPSGETTPAGETTQPAETTPAAETTPSDDATTHGPTANQPAPPDDAAAMAPSEGETAVLSPEQPTTVLPPVASAPGYAPLTRTAVVAPPRDGRPVLWIVVVAAAAVLVAIVVMWAVFSGGSGGDAFLGTWARAAEVGGGLKVEQEGASFMVTWYDGQLTPQGPFAATVDDDVLSFQVPTADGSLVDATLRTTEDPTVLDLTVSGATERVTKVATLTPATGSSTPAPAPAPTPSPTPSPSPSVSGSPSPSPSSSSSPSPSPSTSATNQAVIDGVGAINSFIVAWTGLHNNVFPTAGDVSAGGAVGQWAVEQGKTWPVNPYTGQPMTSGSAPGDYVYEQLQNGQSYKLMGYLANGLTYTAR